MLLEGLEGAEVVADGLGEVTRGLAAALGGEVRPESGVVDVPTEVEREVLLVEVDRGQVAALAGVRELLERGVGAGHVGLVVLGVVELHDATRDVRLERTVVVAELRKGVDSHSDVLLDVVRSRGAATHCITRKAREHVPTRDFSSRAIHLLCRTFSACARP